MNNTDISLTRESICVTCLSQDRTLFPVNESKSYVLCLNLSEGDYLCWECNFFVLKVAAFRNRAARAQVLLTGMLNGAANAIKIASLSRLKTTSVFVETSVQTPDPLQVYVKAEPLKPIKEEPKNNFDDISFDGACGNAGSDESDDQPVSVAVLPVLKKRKKRKNEELCDEATGDIANATLKSLLNRTSTFTLKLTSEKNIEENAVSSDIQGSERDKEVAEPTQTARTDPENVYTVTVLSEEEMLKWRERKKVSEYYTKSIIDMGCEQCIEPFTDRKSSIAHARRHKEDYGAFACHICGVRSVSEKTLAAHTKQHYRLLTCNACGFEWDSANTMRDHCWALHGAPITVWDCNQCERHFLTQRQLCSHMICHRVVTCRECGKQVRQNNIKKHKMLHEGRIPLRCCAVCGGQYRGDEGLASHMRTHDSKVDAAAFCTECHIQFKTMQQYRNHLRYTLKHARSDDMPFKCSFCAKSFLTRAMHELHVDGVHSSEPRHACRVCGEKFKTRIAKRNHERAKHEGVAPVRNKICDQCGRAFTNKSTLQDHINMHTGARPFACKLCDATFGYKSALYLHGRYKHKIKKKNKTVELPLNKQVQDADIVNK